MNRIASLLTVIALLAPLGCGKSAGVPGGESQVSQLQEQLEQEKAKAADLKKGYDEQIARLEKELADSKSSAERSKADSDAAAGKLAAVQARLAQPKTRVVFSDVGPMKEVAQKISGARQQVLMFIPMPDEVIADAVRQAEARGVDVRAIIDVSWAWWLSEDLSQVKWGFKAPPSATTVGTFGHFIVVDGSVVIFGGPGFNKYLQGEVALSEEESLVRAYTDAFHSLEKSSIGIVQLAKQEQDKAALARQQRQNELRPKLEAFLKDECALTNAEVTDFVQRAPDRAYDFIDEYTKRDVVLKSPLSVFASYGYDYSGGENSVASWFVSVGNRFTAARPQSAWTWPERRSRMLANIGAVVVDCIVTKGITDSDQVQGSLLARMKSDLRAAGVTVVSSPEYTRMVSEGKWYDFERNVLQGREAAFLTLLVDCKTSEESTIFSCSLRLARQCRLEYWPWATTSESVACVWDAGTYGRCHQSKAAESFKDDAIQNVDEFIEDYWKVNRRPSATPQPATAVAK